MKKTIWLVIIMLIISSLAVGFYYHQKNRTDWPEDTIKKEDEISILLKRDLSKDYPLTAKETITLYNRMIKEMYLNDNGSKVEELGLKIRDLYDEEFLLKNTLEDYLFDLKIEVAAYREKGKVIRSYEVDSENAINKEIDGIEYTTISSLYRIKDKKNSYRLTQEFILRKDDLGRWKILGWREIKTD